MNSCLPWKAQAGRARLPHAAIGTAADLPNSWRTQRAAARRRLTLQLLTTTGRGWGPGDPGGNVAVQRKDMERNGKKMLLGCNFSFGM